MWKNIVEPDRPQMTVWSVRITCRVPKGKNTHSEYVILIAFILQQWLNEGALSYVLCILPLLVRITVYCCIYSPRFVFVYVYYQLVLFNAGNLSYCDKLEHFATDISAVRFDALVLLCMCFHCYVILEQRFLQNKQLPVLYVIAFCCCHIYVKFMFLWMCMPHCFSVSVTKPCRN